MNTKKKIIFTFMALLILVIGLYAFTLFMPDKYTRLKESLKTNISTNSQGNIYVNQTNIQNTTVVNKEGGKLGYVLFVLTLVVCVILATILIYQKKYTTTDKNYSKEYCQEIAKRHLKDWSLAGDPILVEEYKDLGKLARYVFFFPLIKKKRNAPYSFYRKHEQIMIDMSRRDPLNEYWGPSNMTHNDWRKEINAINKNQLGALHTESDPYKPDIQSFFKEDSAAHDIFEEKLTEKVVDNVTRATMDE